MFRDIYKYINIYVMYVISLLCLFFVLFPNYDILISSIFYNKGHWYKSIILDIMKYTLLIIPIFYFKRIITSFNFKTLFLANKKKIYVEKITLCITIVLFFLFNVFLIAHTLSKKIFHRPRPYRIKEFNGDMNFEPACSIEGDCLTDCSFFSSHAAFGFSIYIFSLLFKKKRDIFLLSSISLGFALGFIRIISGMHFFSDVLFACLFTFLLAHIFDFAYQTIKNQIKYYIK